MLVRVKLRRYDDIQRRGLTPALCGAGAGPRSERSNRALQKIYLNFHGLGTPPPNVDEAGRPYWLAPQQFETFLRLAHEQDPENRRVRFSFDDGNQSDVTIALPLLQKYGRRAAFFLISDAVGRPGFVSQADVARLRDAGMTIGSHGQAHTSWTNLGSEELTEQVSRSLQTLSDFAGQKIVRVAVPFGDYDCRVLRVLSRLGVASVYTSDGGPTRSGAWIKARTTVRTDTPIEAINTLMTGRLTPAQRFRFFARRWRRRLR